MHWTGNWISLRHGLDWLRAGRSGDRIPVGAKFSALVQAGPRDHPASYTIVTGSFPGVKSGREVTLTPYPLLVPWSWKSRAIPLLPIWAVRPVQSLSACTRVHFTFTFGHERVELYLYSPYGPYGLYRTSVPIQACTYLTFLYTSPVSDGGVGLWPVVCWVWEFESHWGLLLSYRITCN
jgi:hypothetical protein